jgi:hypothetical protein
MRIMAVRAAHTGREHSALREGSPHIRFIADLTVVEVESLIEQSGAVAVKKRGSDRRPLAEGFAPRMTSAAGVHLNIVGGLRSALCDALSLGATPAKGIRRFEGDGECCAISNVISRRPMAGFTPHIDFGERSLERARRDIEALAQSRRMANRTLRIPVVGE